ncbi:MAG: hypothetical protein ACHBN1_28330 [Heteroscytonema crispum UTEX LB 1556]
MYSIIEKLKLYSTKKLLKKNRTREVTFTCSERQKQFADYFSRVKLTFLRQLYQFNYLHLPLALNAKLINKQCQICVKSSNFLCNFLYQFISKLIQVTNAAIFNLGNIYYLYISRSERANSLETICLYLFLRVKSKTGADFLKWYANYQHPAEELPRTMPLDVETEATSVDENILIKNSNKLLTDSNVCDNCISYVDSLDKPIARYFIRDRAGFNIFYCGTDAKFRITKFQRVQISEPSDSSGYKIIVADKEISLKGVLKSLVKNLPVVETFAGNDVIKLLLALDSQIDIIPIMSSWLQLPATSSLMRKFCS